jgi:hypothetical protein
MKQLALIPFLFLFIACSSPKKVTSSSKEPEFLPDLPLSELDIPIKIASAPLLARIEKMVPSEFASEGWPGFMQPSCDFRYKYRFIRTGLQFSCVNNLVIINFGGNYQISGSKCLCTAGISVTPWISGYCGFPPQPLRKVSMSLSTNIQFLPNYRLKTTTNINQIQPLDKCSVSIFSSDITQLVMDSIRSSLVSFTSALDQNVSGLNLEKFTRLLKDSVYKKIPIGHYGYFSLNPNTFRVGQLNLVKDSFLISLGISCRPQLSSDPSNQNPEPSSLPALLPTENRSGVRVYLNMNYDFNFLTNILHDSLYNKVFEIKGRTIVVKDASIRGMTNHQIELRIDFAGSNHGSIYLRGTPVLDTAKQTLEIPDIQYSLEGEDLALKIVHNLFRNKIRKTLKGNSYLDISAYLNANKKIIYQSINKELFSGFYSSGYIQEAKIIGMLITPQNVQIQIFADGELKLLGGNL